MGSSAISVSNRAVLATGEFGQSLEVRKETFRSHHSKAEKTQAKQGLLETALENRRPPLRLRSVFTNFPNSPVSMASLSDGNSGLVYSSAEKPGIVAGGWIVSEAGLL